jgi:hypothetical protein
MAKKNVKKAVPVAAKSSKKMDKTVKKVPKIKASIKRNFCLLDNDNNDIARYVGKAPRQAALKIANTGVTDIRLRETGVYRSQNTPGGKIKEIKVHKFVGSRIQRAKIDSDPEWLPAMVNIPKVEKVGIEWVVKNDS